MNTKTTAFPMAIPPKPLGYAEPSFALEWAAVQKRLSQRMKKLRTVARGLKGEDEDKIACAIQRVFCDQKGVMLANDQGDLLLDTLSAAEIKAAIKPILRYVQWQEFARFPKAIAVVNNMFVTTKEWSTIARNLGFGGSDTAILSGIRKYNSSEQAVYYSKTRLPLTENDDRKAFMFQYGHEKEPLVIDTFCRKTGAKVIPCPFMWQHRQHKYMTANIDAVVQMPDGTLAIFEAKTSSTFSESEWKVGPPPQYLRQPMHYMAVLDDDRINRAYIGCVMSNAIDGWYCHAIERDLVAEDELIRNEAAFFNHYIKPGIVPDMTGEKDRDLFAYFTYVKSVEKIQAGKDVELASNYLTTFRNWQALDAEKQRKEAELQELNDKIAATALAIYETLGEDEKSGYLDDGDTGMRFTVSCRVSSRTTIDKDALRLLSPEIYKQVAVTKPSVAAPAISYKKVPRKKGA